MMDPSVELRKLLPSHVRELASMLETHELWKRLMNTIPKTLDRTMYQCDITLSNQHKYNSEHFRLIESESEKSRRTCTEILFDEWGTSGRVRPALGHLLYLLTKAKLFRAADYVAIDLLHQEKPARPDVGPEAPISVNLSELENPIDNEFEKVLDDIDYVSDAVNLIRTYSDKTPKRSNRIPEIVITPDADENINTPRLCTPVVVQRTKLVEEVSDMIKFSSSHIQNTVSELDSQEIPAVINEMSSNSSESIETSTSNSDLQRSNLDSQLNMPNLSMIMDKKTEPVSPAETTEITTDTSTSISNSATESSTGSSVSSEPISSENYNPAFSQILESSDTSLSNQNSSNQNGDENVPNLPILNLEHPCASEENMIPDFDVLQQTSEDTPEQSNTLPDLSALQQDNQNVRSNSIATLFISLEAPSDISSKSRSCSSPLPNLSLDTVLPHIPYERLEEATNNFHPDQYKGENLKGRLLGKGEFGSVFLATSLLDRPVACKKLDIGDVEMVSVNDDVTKQFKCEVEVLSKYTHENLLSLLGYSCDGCTYCLLYEYIPGGALKDRLQDVNNQLLWKQRLKIAFGTSKAISYLHTAFATPLIHRDIKSANILLDSQNQPKLADFGLIKLIPNQNINTATTVFGTSAYMPREAFGGDISVKLDTFSFGVVLLELLTSLPPIDNNREGADLVTHIGEIIENDNITPIVDYKAGSWKDSGVNYSEKLYKIAQTCLEEKKNRPTMIDVKMALDEIIKEIRL